MFLILMVSSLSVFVVVVGGGALGIVSKKSLLDPKSRRLTPMFSFKNFIVLGLTFRSLICFKLLFACEVKVQLHSFTCGYQVAPAPFVEKITFPIEWTWHPSQNSVDHK